MAEHIWYELKSHTNLNNIEIDNDNLSIVKIDLYNFDIYKHLIQLSIDTFNSEIQWDGMWDIDEAHDRVSTNQKLYLLLKNELPIGHVWFIGEFLYNAFVSNKRIDGESQWFICKAINDRFIDGYNTTTLYTEEWNIRAIKFWEKLGFSIINKNKLIEYGRECIHETQGNN